MKVRQVKILAIGAITLAVTGMSFSFASMSTKLDIQGRATMGSANWDVHFDNLSAAKLTGSATEVTHPTITNSDTTISQYHVRLNEANDSIQYDFEIVNDGGMDAKITTLNVPTPRCTGKGTAKETDEALVCNNLEYKLVYDNLTPLKIGDSLSKGSRKKVLLQLVYKGSDLPIEEVEIDNLGVTVIYSQE